MIYQRVSAQEANRSNALTYTQILRHNNAESRLNGPPHCTYKRRHKIYLSAAMDTEGLGAAL